MGPGPGCDPCNGISTSKSLDPPDAVRYAILSMQQYRDVDHTKTYLTMHISYQSPRSLDPKKPLAEPSLEWWRAGELGLDDDLPSLFKGAIGCFMGALRSLADLGSIVVFS